MIVGILEHTPTWVWIVLAVVLILGIQQTRLREISRERATTLPLVMVILSLTGVLGAFGAVPAGLVAWVIGFALSFYFAADLVAVRGASWSEQTQRFTVPGSWIPLLLIAGIFITKYSAGAYLSLHPGLARDWGVALPLSLVYGVFAGLFWARARSLHA